MTTALQQEKRQYLKWWDIGVVTLIMFAYFIGLSFEAFFALEDMAVSEPLEFTSETNWSNLMTQSILLGLTMVYLYFRKFDFSTWPIRIILKGAVQGLFIFIFTALLMDVYLIGASEFFSSLLGSGIETMGEEGDAVEAATGLSALVACFEPSVVIYSMLNGFYEEIFFLGICLSVLPEHKYKYFIYSLLIRYSFHTYQGNVSAIGIGLLVGISYFVIYQRMKEKNLFPFFFAHTISDIIGLGILNYLVI